MRGTYAVATHVLEDFYLTYECGLVKRGAERAEVVVEAHAFYLACHTVELETVLFGERKRTNAEAREVFVHCLAVFLDGGAERVERRAFGRPEARQFERHGSLCFALCAEIAGALCYNVALVVENGELCSQPGRRTFAELHRSIDFGFRL